MVVKLRDSSRLLGAVFWLIITAKSTCLSLGWMDCCWLVSWLQLTLACCFGLMLWIRNRLSFNLLFFHR